MTTSLQKQKAEIKPLAIPGYFRQLLRNFIAFYRFGVFSGGLLFCPTILYQKTRLLSRGVTKFPLTPASILC